MITEYNRKSLMLGIPGIILQIACYVAASLIANQAKAHGATPADTSLIFACLGGQLLGTILLIVGLCFYSKAKGYTPVLGLLGLFSCLGLLILAVLPDKTKGQ